MRDIIYFVFSIVFLFSVRFSDAQSYYYYKGAKQSISLDKSSFSISADTNALILPQILSDILFIVDTLIWDNSLYATISFYENVTDSVYQNAFELLKNHIFIHTVNSNFTISKKKVGVSPFFYVKLFSENDYPTLVEMAETNKILIVGNNQFLPSWYTLKCTKQTPLNTVNMANLFFETGLFAAATPDFLSDDILCVNDSCFGQQWGLFNNEGVDIQACKAWQISRGSNIKVAILDKGIDLTHIDLMDNISSMSYDTESESSPSKLYGYHGTHCAGIVGAIANNHVYIAGVSPECTLYSISNTLSSTPNSRIKRADGINWAWKHDADIINNSWKSAVKYDIIDEAIDSALVYGRNGLGTVVVFAVGNDHDTVSYPANSNSDIIAVGAVTTNGNNAYFSNYGPEISIVAPGVDILSTKPYDTIGYEGGTSMAAPHITGVAALILAINPYLSHQEVKNILELTTQKTGNNYYTYHPNYPNGTWNQYMGYGLVDAHRAVLKAAYHKIYGDITFSICDTNIRVYSVRAPHNANIDSVSFFWTCSDNLQMVAGQTTDSVWVKRVNGGIGQLQCHIIHDGDTVVSALDIPVISDRTVYDNMSLNNGITFPDTFVLSREIVIDSLDYLTWQDKTVLCTPDCRIIVRPSGFMTIDHTTLTSACPNRMWHGIEVMGDRTRQQIRYYQGVLLIENGSVVANAFTAVRNGLSSDNGYLTTGGIIHALSSTFRNNCRALEINPYVYSSLPGNVSDYVASFRQCTFTLNDQNLFATNDTTFTEHVRLWGVKGLTFKGCNFSDSTSTPILGRRGIYTEDAGFSLDTHCSIATTECTCPESYATYSALSGFTTAVEVNTTGDQYPVTVNEMRFSNNITGLKINGNTFATVTRNIFDLNDAPFTHMNVVGLDLQNATGYKVEADTFLRDANSTTGIAQGITVSNNVVVANNTVYHNYFQGLNYGIYLSGTNGNLKKGLQILCNDFKTNSTDIHIASNATLYSNQGNSNSSAGNTFDKKVGLDIVNNGSQNINYYYTGGTTSVYYPDQCTGLVTRVSTSKANSCTPTLCDNGGSTSESLSDFLSDMDADTYYDAVRAIMADSLLDLSALEQWHAAAQPIGDPYSLTETQFMEGYAETFAGDAEDAEMANYAEFHAMKLALRGQYDNTDNQDNNNNSSNSQNSPTNSPFINWYALTPAQIAQLQTIAERNTGRASVMAKGVLCFFHGICYEDEWTLDVFDTSLQDGDTADTRAKRTALDSAEEAVLTVHPNPTEDILYIELSGAEIATAALYDLQGRVIGANNYSPLQDTTATFSLKSVPSGVYVLYVTDTEGREHHQKIVKK